MTTELEMKEALDGWFYSFDYEHGRVISTAVRLDHIPDHKPRIADIDEIEIRVNGNSHKWTEYEDNLIVQRREAGDTFGEIGNMLGLSQTAILKRYKIVCTQRGIRKMARNHGRPRKFSVEIEDQIVAYRQDGKSFTDIAHLMKMLRSQVYEVYRTYRVRKDKQRSLERVAA